METPRTNGLATTCLVLSILSLLTCGGFAILPLLGLILGAVALGQINASGGRQTGGTLAMVGLAVNVLAFLMLPITAAILFPVFAKAREKARQASCSANEKQLALACLQYAADYDERYPDWSTNWSDATEPYYRSSLVLDCPADTNGKPSYQFGPTLRGKEAGKLTDPANAVMLFESDDGKSVVWRHNDGANYGYADGHIKWLGKASTPQGLGSP